MGLVERFKQCNVKEGLFRRSGICGSSYPSNEEREEIARVLSEHLDEVGADIGPNLVGAMAKAFSLDDYYLSSSSGQSLWFTHSSNHYLEEPYEIKIKKIREAIIDHVKSCHLDWWADKVKLSCPITRGGMNSVVYYKGEDQLKQYLSETLKKPRITFELTWNGSKIGEERSD